VNAICPWCEAPRVAGPTCPHCGANYAKAEAIKQHGHAGVPATDPTAPTEQAAAPAQGSDLVESDDVPLVHDPHLELKFCVSAIPVMFVLAVVFHAFSLGHMLQRTFLSMPVHELGHALTAWLCGFPAIPTLWFTRVADERSIIGAIALFSTLGYLVYRAREMKSRELLALGVTALLLQLLGTLFIKTETARALIAFGGDAMGMVIATLLAATFFFGKNTQLYKGSLRWGFVAIGAAAFVDIYSTWWAAHSDITEIPFGMIEGGVPSDALTLVDEFGWSKESLVRRYFGLGSVCMLGLAAIYAWGVRRAWRASVPGDHRAAKLTTDLRRE
jgi:hypothetical protein